MPGILNRVGSAELRADKAKPGGFYLDRAPRGTVYAPGTGTPVWGGLTSAQTAAIMRGLAGIHLIGGDVVEVAPAYDHANITALAAAHVAYEIIALWGWTRRVA